MNPNIQILWATTPEPEGWPVAYHCSICKQTVIVLVPWAWRTPAEMKIHKNVCVGSAVMTSHNIEMTYLLKGKQHEADR